ncbi:uncharacterized protein LOC130263727 isoform X2 [Oenanthe melanoleuca]|uniref:uncharacterized protein LOC130263727 isoform X2 n=1 Tax=Oenanthe melanoleuca TaxID=2939378 RepID=UPI0024C19EAD|nr:uncharacterized protein LOC130263727 isoform X2 [Oenanthe melanoleuca]
MTKRDGAAAPEPWEPPGRREGQCRPVLRAEAVGSPGPWGNRPEREGTPTASPERGIWIQLSVEQFVTKSLVLWQEGSLSPAQVAPPGCRCAASGEAGRGVTFPRPTLPAPVGVTSGRIWDKCKNPAAVTTRAWLGEIRSESICDHTGGLSPCARSVLKGEYYRDLCQAETSFTLK